MVHDRQPSLYMLIECAFLVGLKIMPQILKTQDSHMAESQIFRNELA